MTRHILVTGTSRGIGRAIVERLGDEDAVVIGHASRAAVRTLAADFADPAAPAALWQAALEALDGRIDVLVNNAGVFEDAPLPMDDADWSAAWARTMQINLTASAELSRHAVLHFRTQGSGGRIVNVASRAAYRGDSPAHWHYAASKAGMIGVTKTIARGYAAESIYAFAVCPGFTLTGMAEEYLASRGGEKLLADIPLGRVATPEEVAETVKFLALDAPPSMTGAVIDINGASFVR